MSFTAQGIDFPTLIQFSVFLPNRVGGLQHLLRAFKGEPLRVLGISVANLVDCAVVRFVFSDSDYARGLLREAGHPFHETALLAVELSDDVSQPVVDACATLLQREVSIEYIYPMFHSQGASSGFILHVDDTVAAAEALQSHGFRLLSEGDLG